MSESKLSLSPLTRSLGDSITSAQLVSPLNGVRNLKNERGAVYQFTTSLTATGTRVLYGIAQCYLPFGKCDIPVLTPAEAGTRFSDPGGMQG